MSKIATFFLTLFLGILTSIGHGDEARPDASSDPGQEGIALPIQLPGTKVAMTVESPVKLRGKGFDYDHTLVVALPASYEAQPEKHYPVLWLMDGSMMLNITLGVLDVLTLAQRAPEMIVVAVGSGNDEGLAGMERRRMDFTPAAPSYFREGLEGELQRKVMPDSYDNFPHLAEAYLDFLIDQARPALAARYRMAGDHALVGHSHGGLFSTYAVFARPGAFSKYMVGSPYLYGAEGVVFEMEEAYARNHSDLATTIFMGAGDAELEQAVIVLGGLVSSMTAMSEKLQLRAYPSLQLKTRIFSGRDHLTVIPDLLMEAIQFLWAQEVSKMPASYLD